MKKVIPLILFACSLLAVLGLTARYDSRHHSLRQQLDEDMGAVSYMDYLRLRDPATGEIPRGIHARELAYVASLGARYGSQATALGIHTDNWVASGPNIGGRTRAIGIDITNEGNILLATAQGGIWRSTDTGKNWSRATAPGQLKDMTALVQDHRTGKTNTWYAGTGELLSSTWRRAQVVNPPYYRTNDIGNGIYKSTDNGASWAVLPATVDPGSTTLDSAFDGVWNIVVDNVHNNSDNVYAAGYGAIMRSTNGGTTWSKILSDPLHPSLATDIAVTSNGVYYAFFSQQTLGTGVPITAGVWRSIDGISWNRISPTGWASGAGRMRIAIAPSNENVVYIGGYSLTSQNPAVLWKYTYGSGDGSGAGGTWEDRSAHLPEITYPLDPMGLNTYGGYTLTLKVYPTDENMLFIGGTNLYRSPSAFANELDWVWLGGYYAPNVEGNFDSSQSYPNHHPDCHDLAFSPLNPRVLYSATDAGIHVTQNCLAAFGSVRPIEWTNLNNHDNASIAYVVGMDHATNGGTALVAGFQDQGSWVGNAGSSWTQWDGGDGCYCAIADHGAAYYMSAQLGYAARFVPPSQSGIQIRPPLAEGVNPQFVTPWMLDPTNTDQMYFVVNDSLWRNDALPSASVSWRNLTHCFAPNGTFISALGMATTPSHRLYYGTSAGQLFRVNDANSASPSPTEITGSIFPTNAFISCVAVDPANGDNVIACFSNYHVISLFASTDAGTTWRNISGNLEQNADGSGDGPSTRWVSIVHQGGQTLYLVGTSVGLFSTSDISSTPTWTQEGTSTIGRITVENIDARQSDGFVAIATQGEGIFTAHVTGGSGVNNMPALNANLSVYPNPAARSATISFNPGEGGASLRILDIAGKTMYSVPASELGTGKYSLDCSRLPIGSYFVELHIGEAVETRQLVIQR